MDAHRIDILDRADNDAIVRLVTDHLHLVFFPTEDRFLDQHRADRRHPDPGANDLLEFLDVIGDAAAGTGQGERGADDRRQADRFERSLAFLRVGDQM